MKRPSFQFYPSDWLSDPNVIAMTAIERGAYIQLLASMWNTEDCSLSSDQEFLAKISHVDKVVITSIYHCFKVVNSKLRHKRLDQERLKQDEYRLKQSDAGKKGMKKRWKKAPPDKVVITKHNSTTTIATPISTTSPSSSDSSIFANANSETLEKKEYGNPEINKVLKAIQLKVGCTDFKESKHQQRIWGNHLYQLMQKISVQEFARRIDFLLADNFKAKNCGSLQFIYREIKGFVEQSSESRGAFIS